MLSHDAVMQALKMGGGPPSAADEAWKRAHGGPSGVAAAEANEVGRAIDGASDKMKEGADGGPSLTSKGILANVKAEYACFYRATLETERRYCGNRGEILTGDPVELQVRDTLSLLLDPRTVNCAHISSREDLKEECLIDQDACEMEMHDADKIGRSTCAGRSGW